MRALSKYEDFGEALTKPRQPERYENIILFWIC
jgi:hypothetical protein